MSDIDPKLIGSVITSIPYEDIFGAPLSAAMDAQIMAANSTVDFISKTGFSTDDKGNKVANYAEFQYQETDPKGETVLKTVRVPLILLMNIPNLEIESGEVDFDLEMSQSAEVKEGLKAEGSLGADLGLSGFNVKFKAKVSYDKQQTRKTDTRARQHVKIRLKKSEQPEALSILWEILRESSIGFGRETLPGLPGA